MFEIYLICICARLSLIASIVGIATGALFMVLGLAYGIMDAENADRSLLLKVIKICRNWAIAMASVFILTPSQEQAITIISVGTVYDYCKNSEQIQQLPDNVVRTLNVVLTKFSDKYDSKEEK